MDDDEDSEDENLAQLLREFGLGDLPANDAGGDNDELPGWDEGDLEGWG